MCCTLTLESSQSDLAAPVVYRNMRDGGCMPCQLPHLSVCAALPQQDIPFQATTSTQAEGLAVSEAVHASLVHCNCMQHFAARQVYDLDGAVQGACDQPKLMNV